MVLTTYNIIAKEVVLDDADKNGEQPIKDDDDEEEEGKKKDAEESKVGD